MSFFRTSELSALPSRIKWCITFMSCCGESHSKQKQSDERLVKSSAQPTRLETITRQPQASASLTANPQVSLGPDGKHKTSPTRYQTGILDWF